VRGSSPRHPAGGTMKVIYNNETTTAAQLVAKLSKRQTQ
jgi:hypothetical protein